MSLSEGLCTSGLRVITVTVLVAALYWAWDSAITWLFCLLLAGIVVRL